MQITFQYLIVLKIQYEKGDITFIKYFLQKNFMIFMKSVSF